MVRNDMAEVNGIKSLCIALLMAGIVTQTSPLAAQEVKHLNPVIEKLAAGKAFFHRVPDRQFVL